MISNKREKLWAYEDDQKLLELIQIHGLKKWKEISNELEKTHAIIRTPKQCRDRWCNCLKAGNKSDFSSEEATQIFTLISIHGTKWSLLSKIIETKTENQIKNFVNATMRRNVRRFNKSKSQQDQIAFTNLKLLNLPEVKEIITAPKNTLQSFFQDKILNERSKEEILIIALEDKKSDSNTGENSQRYAEDFETFSLNEDFVISSSNFSRKESFSDIESYLDSI